MLRLLPWIMLNSMLKKFPQSKVLVIASDIAKYGIGTPGEPTQGAGAVAMLISQNPRILSFNDDNVAQTRDVMDFWRPNYATTPLREWDLFNATISRFSENNLGGIPETDWPCLDRLCSRLLPLALSEISSQGLEKNPG